LQSSPIVAAFCNVRFPSILKLEPAVLKLRTLLSTVRFVAMSRLSEIVLVPVPLMFKLLRFKVSRDAPSIATS
jgi:hypothetical protein